MTSYANIIAGPAAVLPGATPRTFREPEEEEDSVFNYVETASDRVGIGLTERLINERSRLSASVGLAATFWIWSPRRRSAKSVSSITTSS
jgi:hypothetical protein